MKKKREKNSYSSSDSFYTPFESLSRGSKLKKSKTQKYLEILDQIEKKGEDTCKSDMDLFVEAMKDVTPLHDGKGERVPPPSPTRTFPRNFYKSEIEAYNCLADLVHGDSYFDLFYSDEYIEGAIHGLPYKVLKKLRRGEFSYQDYLDLHGYTRKEAKLKVLYFLERSYAKGHRCVLIIPGRGLNSVSGKSVLKQGLIKWLTHGSLRNIVLAFSSARACDGGLGALYVLLRRNKRRGKFFVQRHVY